MSVCATCYQPGLPADGQHDCPGLGDIQLTRQYGRGIIVDTAPARARLALNILADHGWGAAMRGPDQINIAYQVLYQVVGYDPISAALVLELVEDWRPNRTPGEDDAEPVGPAKPGIPRCTATWNTEHQGIAHCWRAATHNQREGYETHMGEAEHGYRFQWIGTEPGAAPHRADPPLNYACAACRAHAVGNLGAHDDLPCVCRDERCESCPPVAADATVCTPIPAETLMQMSKVPPELLTEEQLGRAENAEAPDEKSAVDQQEQAAPVDWEAVARRRERELKLVGEARQLAEAEVDRLRAGEESGWDPLTVPTPGQWIARFNRASAAERLDVAQRVIGYTATAGTCFEMNHVRRLEDEQRAQMALARVRDEVAHWGLSALEPQAARVLDGIDRALRGDPEPEPAHGFVPARPKHWPRGEMSGGDPLAVEPYRNDRNQGRWVFRCWGTATCDGWLSLDHHSQESAERARERHVAEEHTTEEAPGA